MDSSHANQVATVTKIAKASNPYKYYKFSFNQMSPEIIEYLVLTIKHMRRFPFNVHACENTIHTV